MQNPKDPAGKGIVARILSDKSGSAYILWTVVIVVLCMIMSCVLSYVMAVTLIAEQKDVTKNILDKQLSTNSVEIYQRIKEQDDYTDKEFASAFLNDLITICDLEAINDTQYQSKTESGDTRYVLTTPTVSYEEDFSPKLVVQYTITVPIEFAGIQVVWVDVPVTVVSRFNPKYDMSETTAP